MERGAKSAKQSRRVSGRRQDPEHDRSGKNPESRQAPLELHNEIADQERQSHEQHTRHIETKGEAGAKQKAEEEKQRMADEAKAKAEEAAAKLAAEAA